LPTVPITTSLLFPALQQAMEGILLQALKAEIEIYKAFPKENGKFDLKKFDPRNHKTCFMGLGFSYNGQGTWYDTDLKRYRNAVGTMYHPVWGDNVTLLEIWGGDHFEKYPDMVRGVFAYCHNKGPLPELFFKANPFFVSENTGTFEADEEDKAEQRRTQLAIENEIRREHGLPLQDYLAEEIEAYRKADNWDEKYRCPKDRPHERKRPIRNEEENDDDE